MKAGVSLALRHKITLAFLLFLAGGLLFVGLIYKRHNTIQEKLKFIEEADDLVNNALEVRRYEKNYFLYGGKENLFTMLEYLTEAEKRLEKISREKKSISTGDQLENGRQILADYRKAVNIYAQRRNQARIQSDDGGLSRLADEIRETGRKFNENLMSIVKSERNHINDLISRQKRSLYLSLTAFVLLAFFVAYYLYFLIISPLSRIERAAMEVISGGVQEIPSVSGSTEIHSLITVLNQMIRELDKKTEQLIQREKMAALGTLTSGVAHELNNPLSNISSSAQILIEELEEDDLEFKKSLLAGIEEQVEKARDIVKSLLEFAREKEFTPGPANLMALVNSALKLVRGEIPPEIDIKVDIPETIDLEVDRRRLSQALINLIFNGVQAMEGSGGVLTISATQKEDDLKVDLEISDTGIGIDSGNLAKIFDPFFSTKDVGRGTGLGLYVTYGIIQKHHGEISVRSEPGRGTSFILTLPMQQPVENHGR
jgi:signal transduction histidine kinase